MPEKEIWKLLELLNEYVEEKDFGDDLNEYNSAEILDEKTLEVNGEYHDIEYLISKSFWFIQRLVEQDKIDISKLDKEEKNQNIDICIYKKLSRDEENTERLLMLLSIQESPIEFLISILKNV